MEDRAAKIMRGFLSSEPAASWILGEVQPKELEDVAKRLVALFKEVEKGLGHSGPNAFRSPG